MKYRAISPNTEAKYAAPTGQSTRLFNTIAVTEYDGDSITVCEGELDALVMHHLVGLPAVGVVGVSQWKDHFKRIFADYGTVYVVTDNDAKIVDGEEVNPGRRLAEKICKELPTAVHISPPAGMDVNEWYLAVGAEGVRAGMGVAA